MVGCDFSLKIRTRLETFFASQVKDKATKLWNKLGNTKKGGFVSDCLIEIKSTIDALIFVGASITNSDHVEVVLNRLTKEYGLFINTIISWVEPILVKELEALLMTQEEMIQKFKRNDNFVQANIA